MRGTERRLENFAQLLGHARERLGLDLGFVLWDGSTVPAGLPDDAFAIMIADEGAVAALIRGPSLGWHRASLVRFPEALPRGWVRPSKWPHWRWASSQGIDAPGSIYAAR